MNHHQCHLAIGLIVDVIYQNGAITQRKMATRGDETMLQYFLDMLISAFEYFVNACFQVSVPFMTRKLPKCHVCGRLGMMQAKGVSYSCAVIHHPSVGLEILPSPRHSQSLMETP